MRGDAPGSISSKARTDRTSQPQPSGFAKTDRSSARRQEIASSAIGQLFFARSGDGSVVLAGVVAKDRADLADQRLASLGRRLRPAQPLDQLVVAEQVGPGDRVVQDPGHLGKMVRCGTKRIPGVIVDHGLNSPNRRQYGHVSATIAAVR